LVFPDYFYHFGVSKLFSRFRGYLLILMVLRVFWVLRCFALNFLKIGLRLSFMETNLHLKGMILPLKYVIFNLTILLCKVTPKNGENIL
jgi:hypothetical protein